MPRPQKRPDYNSNIIMKDLLDAVSEYYCSSDDKNGAKVSLHDVADEFGFTHMKARKLLITAGVYHTDLSDQVNELKRRGKTIQQIMEATGLKRAAVHNYLPYTKMVYNAEELSLNAERIRRFRNRQNTVKKIEEHFATGSGRLPALVWSALEEFQEYPFRTADGQKFSFAIKGTKIVINQEKVLSKASINRALQQVIEMERKVMQPEDLQLPEAGFLYPVFKRIKIIE